MVILKVVVATTTLVITITEQGGVLGQKPQSNLISWLHFQLYCFSRREDNKGSSSSSRNMSCNSGGHNRIKDNKGMLQIY